MNDIGCPLCGCARVNAFFQDNTRLYYQCEQCELVFVPPHFYLSACDEKAQYDLHQNNDEPHYRQFLQRVYAPLILRLEAGARGLDFGCGPGPVLATMFAERGHSMALFDPFYFPDTSVLQQQYDFITATEVFEHLQQPRQVIQTLWPCLRAGGTLALMTKLVLSPELFSRWHYKTDPTHIIFFSRSTFVWLAENLGAEVEFIANDVIFLRKNAA
ncbi:MAG TPA: class I SAM-dependent methyltransferase [Cellvibrio sp.]|nr:class I SAM-dependent methyltransferase [Cellvibrio sp.]